MSSPLTATFDMVRDRVREACRKASRDPATVRIVAVSKQMPVSKIRQLLETGHKLFGENRIQEALAKIPEIDQPAEWHMVGHLQTNKARQAVGLFSLIHSVDSMRLLTELDRVAALRGLEQSLLIQVNLSGETTKSGVTEEALPALLDACATLDHVRLCGLMTLPPRVDTPDEARVWFSRLRELHEAASTRLGIVLPELSMGMSNDFEAAIAEGATLVRVGRAIFGERTAKG
jgi:pyridoxal phosphate enzyme (YggS family)